jgi:uncharacterized protein YcgI (DUF1989 family)
MTTEIAPGASWAGEMAAGAELRITARSVASLVCFNAVNLRERFDQARTKVYNMKIWLAAGDALYSKLNNPLMTLVDDGFGGAGKHDAQYPGCRDLLAPSLAPWSISAMEVPQPLNLLLHADIDTGSGLMTLTGKRPAAPVTMVLRAEIALVVGLAACPDAAADGGAPVRIAL